MSTTNGYVVEVKGPKGVKIVHLPKEQVEFFEHGPSRDPYVAAAWLAYCDLWVTSDE